MPPRPITPPHPAQASDIDDSNGKDVLLCATSHDDGASWSEAQPIQATLGRPPSIRDTGSFEVYPGTLQTLPDDRVLVTWQYIATGDRENYSEGALCFAISEVQALDLPPSHTRAHLSPGYLVLRT